MTKKLDTFLSKQALYNAKEGTNKTMRKKILLCITKPTAGGAQKYIYDLATHLPADRFEVAVIAGSPHVPKDTSGQSPLFGRLHEKNIRTVAIPGLNRDINPIREIQAFVYLVKTFIKEKPDIIHLNSSKMGSMGALAAWTAKILTLNFKPRVIFTVHGWGFREDRSLLQQAAIFTVSWISALFHTHIITINSADHADARAFIPIHKISLIPLGISKPDFLSRSDARAFFSHISGKPITDQTVLIGTTAELVKNKGLSYLIDSLRHLLLSLKRSHIHLIIMGEGEERRHLSDQINVLNLDQDITLAGFITDAYRYLPGLDIFALSSVKEGLPYALMEAMAAELPVIASHIGGIPDLIIHGENGFLAPAKNFQLLASHLHNLISSPARRTSFGSRAKETIITSHSLDHMITQTANCYDQLTSSHQ